MTHISINFSLFKSFKLQRSNRFQTISYTQISFTQAIDSWQRHRGVCVANGT